ncbi:hypothetical protein PAEPH01_2364, partial [Pancytospora epiphaga]
MKNFATVNKTSSIFEDCSSIFEITANLDLPDIDLIVPHKHTVYHLASPLVVSRPPLSNCKVTSDASLASDANMVRKCHRLLPHSQQVALIRSSPTAPAVSSSSQTTPCPFNS